MQDRNAVLLKPLDLCFDDYRKPEEIWYQDESNFDLWHGENGVIVNTTALNERQYYYHVLAVEVI